VVFDSNVLLAAMFTHGLCETLLDECFVSQDRILLASDHIMQEFYRRAVTKFGVTPQEAQFDTDFLRKHLQVVEPASVSTDACRDPKDLPILGTAQAAAADYLVTGDKDLLVLQRFEKTIILSPRQFYDKLRA
jgi:hypothetical protein